STINHGITDSGVISLVDGCPDLEFLDLGYNRNITEVSVAKIVDSPGLEKLVSLVLTGCSGINIQALGWLSRLRKRKGKLKTITIGDCTQINDSHISNLISSSGSLSGWTKSHLGETPEIGPNMWDQSF
ncbi:hypothetical protein BJ742DRAFT_807098, partial [Cladochytrium replicatum]